MRYFLIDDWFEMLAIEELIKVHKFQKKKVERLDDALRFAEMCARSTSSSLRIVKRG
jgi:hypothetical protein